MPVKFSDARPTQASPRIIVSASTKPPAAGSAVSAAEVMAAMAAADGYDSDSSDVSDTEVAAMRSIIRQHGADWREKPEIEPEDLLAEEKETIKIRALQERGQLPRDEDPTVNKPRVIAGKMIQNASRKLPREVHRKILDIFQVIILEPYYYPPECKVRNNWCSMRRLAGRSFCLFISACVEPGHKNCSCVMRPHHRVDATKR